MTLRFAVSGSKGAGKTTIVALMARMLAQEGVKVLALDAASHPSLAAAVGISPPERKKIRPLSTVYERVEKNASSKPRACLGDALRMDPVIVNMTETLSVEGPDKVEVLVLGTIKKAGGEVDGAEPALLRGVMDHLLLEEDEVVLLDMEAELDHLDRRTARSLDGILVVVEPKAGSLRTAEAIAKRARELGANRITVVANKVMEGEEGDALRSSFGEINLDLLASIPFNDGVSRAAFEGKALIDAEGIQDVKAAVRGLKSRLVKR